jgi:protein gp37
MGQTKIEWTNKVWNPITGCSPVSEGCQNCYAKRMAYRLKGRYGYPKDDPFRVTFHPDRLDEPLRWKKPCRIFVCSMGDLFHGNVLWDWQISIFEAICKTKHNYLFLTKRVDNMRCFFQTLEDWNPTEWPNVWLGVSVEDQKTTDERIPILLQIPAAKRFVSVEPMLGTMDISNYLPQYKFAYDDPVTEQTCYRDEPIKSAGAYKTKIEDGLNWVICGGETGPKARPLHPDWVRLLRDQCQAAGVPFFFKGWGDKGEWEQLTCGHWYQKQGKKSRLLDGKIWEEYP